MSDDTGKKPHPVVDEFEVAASEVLDKVKALIHEGNVRRLIIREGDRTVFEVPLTFAAVGVALAPLLAAVGALAALAHKYTIVVERKNEG